MFHAPHYINTQVPHHHVKSNLPSIFIAIEHAYATRLDIQSLLGHEKHCHHADLQGRLSKWTRIFASDQLLPIPERILHSHIMVICHSFPYHQPFTLGYKRK